MNCIEEFGYDISGLKAYSGYFKDKMKLKESASGGIASAIAEQFIARGGVVFGVKYSEDFRNAEFCMAQDVKDLSVLKGSKYIASKKEILIDGNYCSVYKVVAEKLSLGTKVLFIGLGCDVAAVKKVCEVQKVNTDSLYTIDLVCHGPTSPLVAELFLDQLEDKYKSRIVNFTVRYKKEGWVPPYIRAQFESGEVYEQPFYETDYGKAFALYSRPSCYNCRFRGENHHSDLTVGDYWGMDESEPEYNKDGVSIAFLNDECRGSMLIDMIDKNKFYIQEADAIRALRGNTNYYTCRNKIKNYQQFEENLKNKGLHYAVVHSVSVPGRIKGFVKKILKKVLPHSVVVILKKILKR